MIHQPRGASRDYSCYRENHEQGARLKPDAQAQESRVCSFACASGFNVTVSNPGEPVAEIGHYRSSASTESSSLSELAATDKLASSSCPRCDSVCSSRTQTFIDLTAC